MIDGLTVANLKKGSKILPHGGEVFSLSTCQRTIIVGLGTMPIRYIEKANHVDKIFHGKDAYQFLLETILGLQSEVVAEYEVVNQFKDAYQKYVDHCDKNSHIITIIEKLFKDQKKIRTEHLSELGQLSYAGIARKIIHVNSIDNKVLIIGSGNLSIDAINLLKKKFEVYITARNSEKAEAIAKEHHLKTVKWLDLNAYSMFLNIVNTIGTDSILFDQNFFNLWNQNNNSTPTKLFIDLGSPSVINTSLKKSDGVYRLEDIFEESLKLNREKMEKVTTAKKAVLTLTHDRHQSFSMSLPFGWEELQFA